MNPLFKVEIDKLFESRAQNEFSEIRLAINLIESGHVKSVLAGTESRLSRDGFLSLIDKSHVGTCIVYTALLNESFRDAFFSLAGYIELTPVARKFAESTNDIFARDEFEQFLLHCERYDEHEYAELLVA